MTGYVYIIGSTKGGFTKIGFTTNLERRLASIQSMSPLPLKILWSTPGDKDFEVEMHRHFSRYRQHGEWFDFKEIDFLKEADKLSGKRGGRHDIEERSSMDLLSIVLDIRVQTPMEKLCLMGLANNCGDASLQAVANWTLFPEEDVRVALDALADSGLVIRCNDFYMLICTCDLEARADR